MYLWCLIKSLCITNRTKILHSLFGFLQFINFLKLNLNFLWQQLSDFPNPQICSILYFHRTWCEDFILGVWRFHQDFNYVFETSIGCALHGQRLEIEFTECSGGCLFTVKILADAPSFKYYVYPKITIHLSIKETQCSCINKRFGEAECGFEPSEQGLDVVKHPLVLHLFIVQRLPEFVLVLELEEKLAGCFGAWLCHLCKFLDF